MITLKLTLDQFFYLKNAIDRDVTNLQSLVDYSHVPAEWASNEFEPGLEDPKEELQIGKSVTKVLTRAEQAQVFPH